MSELPFWSVPRCFEGQTVAILGGGQSLTQDQIDQCRGRCRVIAINRAYSKAPWADWLWAPDPGRFWVYHSGPRRLHTWPDALEFPGLKITLWSPDMPGAHARELLRLSAAEVKILRHGGRGTYEGLSDDPGIVRGNNACAHILSIIRHTGATRVLLLGIDMHGKHWHEGYPGIQHPPYATAVAPLFNALVAPLAQAGLEVLNCSPGTALDAFPKADLNEAALAMLE